MFLTAQSASIASLMTLGVILSSGAFAAPTTGLHNESEAGIVITSGNSNTQTFNFKQLNAYGWDLNLLRFNGKFLSTNANDTETARSWALGLRYERELVNHFSVFAGQNVESDIFSGILQRYNTDVGGQYFIFKEETFTWDAEAGYRYTLENRALLQVKQHYLRFFTEAYREWNKSFSTKITLEFLPNLSESSDYQFNTELSGNAAINDIFAIKVGYLIKYRNVPVAPATKSTDTQFTTALVAKF